VFKTTGLSKTNAWGFCAPTSTHADLNQKKTNRTKQMSTKNIAPKKRNA